MANPSKGISILELLVVMAIVGILAGLGFVNLPRDRFAVNQAAEGLARDVQLARFEAIRRNSFVDLRVDQAENRYRIIETDTDQIIKTVSLGGSATPQAEFGDVTNDGIIRFDPRGIGVGAAGIDVEIRSATGNYTRDVRINAQGRASIE